MKLICISNENELAQKECVCKTNTCVHVDWILIVQEKIMVNQQKNFSNFGKNKKLKQFIMNKNLTNEEKSSIFWLIIIGFWPLWIYLSTT